MQTKITEQRIINIENSFKTSFARWKLLKDLSLKKLKKEFTSMDLANLLNTQRTNPYFIDFIILFEYKGILKVIKKYGRMKIYLLDQNKLMKFIEESPIFKEFKDYIYHSGGLYINV